MRTVLKRQTCKQALVACLTLLPVTLHGTGSTDAGALLDKANKLYEQGLYLRAANAYEALVKTHGPDVNVLFNLGNAWFRVGRPGKAITAYRRAQQLKPRDPDIRFNLDFVRNNMPGRSAGADRGWSRAVAQLTLNEWTILSTAGFWIWILLLSLGEWRNRLRPHLRGYVAIAGTLTLLAAIGFGVSARQWLVGKEAVVVVPQAIVRLGPLQESQIHCQLAEGSELTVLGEREVSHSGLPERWLKVSDAAGRKGWLRRSQVEVIDNQ